MAHQLLSGHPLLLCVRRKQECPCSSLVVAPPESHHSSLWQFGLWALQFQISQRGSSSVSQSFPFKLSELGWGPQQEHGGGGDLSPDRIPVDGWGSWGWNEASLYQVPGPPHAVSQISPPTKTAAGVPVFSQRNGRTEFHLTLEPELCGVRAPSGEAFKSNAGQATAVAL